MNINEKSGIIVYKTLLAVGSRTEAFMDFFIFIFEMMGIAAYGVSGALTATKRRMDMFGTIVLGVTTAVGGGVIRDIVLGSTPPRSFVHPIYVAVAAAFSALVLIPCVRRLITNNRVYDVVMFLLDTAGLGLFTVMGVAMALESAQEYNTFLVVFVGVITGVGGGVLRDMFSGGIPYIFVKHIYACASIAGAVVCAMMWDGAGKVYAMLAGVAVIVIIRCLSAHFRWNLPVSEKEK